MKKGFTLIEIILVVTIVLIITRFAITSSLTIAKNLRFNNTINKLVLMVQNGRNLAITAKDSNTDPDLQTSQYGIEFNANYPATGTDTAYLFDDRDNDGTRDTGEDLERYNIHTNFYICGSQAPFPATNPCQAATCTTPTKILFKVGTGEPMLRCGGSSTNLSMLQISVQDVANNTRVKSFTIHQASGIPQVQN